MCNNNELKDLEHFPEVSDYINIDINPVYLLVYTFIENEETDSFMIEDFVDYEIVRNRDTVMLDRLQTFIRDNNLKMPDLEEIKKHYKIIE
jgi:low affinity Fe/Cu permease